MFNNHDLCVISHDLCVTSHDLSVTTRTVPKQESTFTTAVNMSASTHLSLMSLPATSTTFGKDAILTAKVKASLIDEDKLNGIVVKL